MARRGKWIEGIDPECGVPEAARLSLGARLEVVAHWLPLAAEHADVNIELVHQLRVGTRRAMAALQVYRDYLPRRPARWLKKRLRKIRRAAGDARDLDVLGARLRRELGDRGGDLLNDIAKRRADAQPDIEAIDKRCRRDDRFQHKTRKLLEGIGPPEEGASDEPPPTFRNWAQQELGRTADRFFSSLPNDVNDVAELHQLRIQGKALRYAIELLAPAFGPELRERQYPVVEQLQERLGTINDHVAGGARLRAWHDDPAYAEYRKLLAELIEKEDAQLAESLEEFRAWWTPERIDGLRGGLVASPA